MLYIDFRQHVLAVLKDKLADKQLVDADFAPVNVEAPKEESHGDLATNAAMVLAKKVGMASRALAEMLVDSLKMHDAVEAVEIAGPGFINFRLKTSALMGEGLQAVKLGDKYGQLDAAKRKAMVEYVSINPTGPIHVGHGRNAVFGDAIANVLEKAGYDVWREYLVNDAGGQIRVLVKSLHARYLQLFGHDIAVPENGYPGEYLIEIAEQLKAKDGDKWVNAADEEALLRDLREFAVDTCLNLIKTDIAALGIEFDRYFSEYAMHQTDRMKEVVQILRDKGLVYEGTLPPPKGKEVADYKPVELTLFKSTEFGLPEDQAIYNRAGMPTYFGQDIAYHFDKLQRGFELLVTVIGIDQSGSFKPLAKAIEALTGKNDVYHPVTYEMVKVLRDGQPVKLSKRAGNIVLLSDVLEEVGSDAFRFTMLTVKPTTPLTFDLAHAVAKTMDNPVFYAQYAHARLCAVERQRSELGIADVNFDNVNVNGNISADARSVLREVMLYPALIEQTARALEPHRLTFYAQNLAATIHRWYAAEKWLDINDVQATHTRLAVGRAARSVLADVLKLCGVNAPASM
ncbi:MAG: arginine--tRNA ligase [Alphaproteobacteria bacterium]|nr:MAG: arginine--tRNA ligase [Alphaproteobacteria bacterium]